MPQEVVQAMRADQAIVFYEGIRPIRCTKIRYFRERRFKRPISPPPRHAAPGMKAPPPAPVATRQRSPLARWAPSASTRRVPQRLPRRRSRRATPQDIERIDEMKLEDFDVDPAVRRCPKSLKASRPTTRGASIPPLNPFSALQER
ncbi:MAG: type IV secretory system conjugative DNA transfer family protein [Sphingomonadales bacterium]|nr:type IV secretory system conjugative DNA transfer family protein [Sphingomonadales bacterium]